MAARWSAGPRRGRYPGKIESDGIGVAFPGETTIRGIQESVLALVRGLVQEEDENKRENHAERGGKPSLLVSRVNAEYFSRIVFKLVTTNLIAQIFRIVISVFLLQ